MKSFDFEKFEKNTDKLARSLKLQMQTRLFHPIAPDFEVEVSVYDRGRGYGKTIAVETTDISEHQNFKMFAKVYLHNFGGSAMKDDCLYWLPIDWRWESIDGGSNGTRAFTCYVNDDGEIVEVKS
jgi:hypothetical protein